jgi:hypothetical protein
VDGVRQFDREADQDDMRINIQPEDDYESSRSMVKAGRSHDACMQDVFYLFGQE